MSIQSGSRGVSTTSPQRNSAELGFLSTASVKPCQAAVTRIAPPNKEKAKFPAPSNSTLEDCLIHINLLLRDVEALQRTIEAEGKSTSAFDMHRRAWHTYETTRSFLDENFRVLSHLEPENEPCRYSYQDNDRFAREERSSDKLPSRQICMMRRASSIPNRQKMSLGEFLRDASLGSWADEMEEMPSQSSGLSKEINNGKKSV
jgi:hypothetical protein